MKQIIYLLLITFLCTATLSFAEESTSSGWDSYGTTIDNSFNNTKPVTNDLFNKTIEKLKSKGKKKKKKNEIVPLSPVPYKSDKFETSELGEIYNKIKHTPTIMLPTDVITDNGKLINTGYYKLSNLKTKDNKYYFVFTQGNSEIARNEAVQTKEDYNQKDINFVDVIPLSDKYIKIIYGTLDLNLETILEIRN